MEIKNKRNVELLKVQEQISAKLANEFMGKTVKVLVEGPSKKARQNDGKVLSQLVGRTGGDWIVIFDGPESLAGHFANVKITRTSPLTLFGEII
jgi:tRNA-2-methylthio-N6-dimethylallyladenosine synthase